jgi:hypothetical protein
VFPLLFFFQIEVRLQFPLNVGIAFPDLPPSHLSSPQPGATLSGQWLPPSASVAILQPQVVFRTLSVSR